MKKVIDAALGAIIVFGMSFGLFWLFSWGLTNEVALAACSRKCEHIFVSRSDEPFMFWFQESMWFFLGTVFLLIGTIIVLSAWKRR